MALGARVVLTGAGGFLGRHVLRTLEVRGDDAVIWSGGRGDGDIRDLDAMRRALAGATHLVHFAAMGGAACAEDPDACREVNVTAPLLLFAAALDLGVERIVYASSVSVYGTGRLPRDERDAPAPVSPYGRAKLELEQGAALFGGACVGLRIFNAYGDGQPLEGPRAGVCARMLGRVLDGHAPGIVGDPARRLDFIHASDVGRAVAAALHASAPPPVVNVCTGAGTSLAHLAEMLAGAVQGVAPAGPPSCPPTDGDLVGDPELAARTIGFRARIPLALGLRRLVHTTARAAT